MAHPVTILGSTVLWPTTGETGYGPATNQFVDLVATALNPIAGLYNTTTGHVGNLGYNNSDQLTLNGLPISNAGTVTSITAGTGLSGGTITTSGTIALANTAVTAGSYTHASITVDAQGRITAASNGSTGVTSFNTRTGAVTLTNTDVNTALGYTAGTVTNISQSGGTTGLTYTGSPITTFGTFTLGGTLNIANGGTGATTAANAINALLPSQTANSGKFLTTNGTVASWATSSGGVTSFNTRTGAVSLTSLDVTGALGFTPGQVSNVQGTTNNISSTGGINPIINLVNTAVTAGTYTNANITVDAFGRITSAANGSSGVGTVTSVSVTGNTGRITTTGSPITGTGTINVDLAASGVAPGNYVLSSITVDAYGRLTSASSAPTQSSNGTYTNANITVDVYGRVTAASNGTTSGLPIGGTAGQVLAKIDSTDYNTHWISSGTVTSVSVAGTTGRITSSGSPITSSGTVTLDLATTGAVPGSYIAPILAIDAYGRITGIGTTSSSDIITILGYTPYNATNPSGFTSNTGTVTSITAGTGLSGGAITTSGTIALTNTTVTPASYTNANITVDAQGRITSASNGSAGGVSSFNTRTGAVTLTSSDVTTALGFTPGTGTVTGAAGSNTQVQYNNTSAFAGSANFTYVDATKTLSVGKAQLTDLTGQAVFTTSDNTTDLNIMAHAGDATHTSNIAIYGSNNALATIGGGISLTSGTGTTTTGPITLNSGATNTISLSTSGNTYVFGPDLQVNADPGTSGQVLTSQGTGVAPIWASGTPGPTGPQGPAGPGYLTTSTTATDLGSSGTLTFTVGTGLGYSAGQTVYFQYGTSPTWCYMYATVTSYNSGTGSLVVARGTIFTGTAGAVQPWTVNLSGKVGAAGVGVPVGGTTGQMLTKIDGTDYNTQWVAPGTGITSLTALTGPLTTPTYIDFATAVTPTTALGRLQWDPTYGTLQLGLVGGNVNLQIGQETNLYAFNNTGSTILNGQIVRVTGASGNKATIGLAQANTAANSNSTIGMATESIANGANGFITTYGLVHDLDTSAYTDGDTLYLSAATAGAVTNIQPVSPNYVVIVGYVVRAHATVGQVLINVQIMGDLTDLSDVDITSPTNGQQLQYNGTTWINRGLYSTSSAAPSTPVAGDRWVDNDTGIEYVYYTDADSSQWVQFGSSALPSSLAVTDITTTSTITSGSNLILPKTSGIGIKVDTSAPTFGWRDILGPIEVRGVGPTDPSFNTFVTNVKAYQFTVGDECWITFHIPHDYVPGSDLFIHTHWAITTTSTANVTWGFDCTYAKGFNQAAFPATTNTTVALAGSGVANQHMISEVQITGASLIPVGNIEVDGLVLVRSYLSANATGVEPFLFTCDIHYQSTNMATKNKINNFYA